MDMKSPQSLEELIQRELSKLPERQAPATLVSGVLARIQAREQRSWWQRPWSYWPSPLKAMSLPFLVATAIGVVFALSLLWKVALVKTDMSELSDRIGSVSVVWDVLSVLGNAVLLLGRSVGQQWLLAALLVPLSMYLACIGLGTLCYRMASNRQ
jgi:hypothetical protein